MERDMAFAEWVRGLRQAANLTQAGLADVVRVSVAAVRNWERGVTVPFPAVLNALADVAVAYEAPPPPLIDRRRGPLLGEAERAVA